MDKVKLSRKQRKELNSLAAAIAEEAVSVRLDYEQSGSNLDSGSVVAIHHNSPLLDDEKEPLTGVAYNIVRRKKMKSKLLEKLAIQIMVVLVGIGGFWAGMYYSMEKLSQEIEKWSSEYEQVSRNLSQYMEIADPQTVRFYVRELNKILDDITFLNNLVKSGQLADESLVVYASMVEDVDVRLIMLREEMHDELESLRLSITVKTDDKVYGLKEDVVTGRKAVLSKLNGINIRLDALEDMVSELSTDVDTIKNSKYGKKIWSENK